MRAPDGAARKRKTAATLRRLPAWLSDRTKAKLAALVEQYIESLSKTVRNGGRDEGGPAKRSLGG
jgi:hypothetical protein